MWHIWDYKNSKTPAIFRNKAKSERLYMIEKMYQEFRPFPSHVFSIIQSLESKYCRSNSNSQPDTENLKDKATFKGIIFME